MTPGCCTIGRTASKCIADAESAILNGAPDVEHLLILIAMCQDQLDICAKVHPTPAVTP